MPTISAFVSQRRKDLCRASQVSKVSIDQPGLEDETVKNSKEHQQFETRANRPSEALITTMLAVTNPN